MSMKFANFTKIDPSPGYSATPKTGRHAGRTDPSRERPFACICLGPELALPARIAYPDFGKPHLLVVAQLLWASNACRGSYATALVATRPRLSSVQVPSEAQGHSIASVNRYTSLLSCALTCGSLPCLPSLRSGQRVRIAAARTSAGAW